MTLRLQYLDNSAGFELGVGPSLVVLDAGFGKNLSTTTLQKGVYAFIFDQTGTDGWHGYSGNENHENQSVSVAESLDR